MSHPNARLTPHGRLLLCRRIEGEGWRVREAASAAGVSRQTVSKWLGRWRSEGPGGLAVDEVIGDGPQDHVRISRSPAFQEHRQPLEQRRGPAITFIHVILLRARSRPSVGARHGPGLVFVVPLRRAPRPLPRPAFDDDASLGGVAGRRARAGGRVTAVTTLGLLSHIYFTFGHRQV